MAGTNESLQQRIFQGYLENKSKNDAFIKEYRKNYKKPLSILQKLYKEEFIGMYGNK